MPPPPGTMYPGVGTISPISSKKPPGSEENPPLFRGPRDQGGFLIPAKPEIFEIWGLILVDFLHKIDDLGVKT